MTTNEYIATIVVRLIERHAKSFHGRRVVFVDDAWGVGEILADLDVEGRNAASATVNPGSRQLRPEIREMVQRELSAAKGDPTNETIARQQ